MSDEQAAGAAAADDRGLLAPTAWAVKVYGTPAPKGSMKCVGRRGKGSRHQLVNSNANTGPWQDRVAEAAQALVAAYPDDMPLLGPIGVDVTVTIQPPKTITREWPFVLGTGDKDKHERAVLDGLEQGGVLTNDAQVCTGFTTKVYPHTDHPDALPRPGAFIRLYRL